MIKKLKKTYKISAIVFLSLAIIVSVFFIVKGMKTKNNVSNSNIPTDQQESDKNLNTNTQVKDKQSTTVSYNLFISKISVSAPISISIDGNNKDEYNKALENGVAHLKGSAMPGKNGNVFIFGHSSFGTDKPGNYKEIFAKLNDLNLGEIIEVQSPELNYKYKISDKKVVATNDVTVAKQNMAIKQITLMTCWPIGSAKERLVIIGELIEG